MARAKPSVVHRAARHLLRATVWAWPTESREWGRALQAEFSAVEAPWDAARWAMGGVLLLTRAWWRQFLHSLKRPLGVPMGSSTGELLMRGEPVPRISRAATALLLIASAGVLLLPDARQALGVVAASWTSSRGLDQETLERLAHSAEQQGDAETLAFAALRLPYSPESVRLADRAMRIDPGLTWIYSVLRPAGMRFLVPTEHVARLRAWDPQNAIVHLVAADHAERALAARWSQAQGETSFFWGRPETNRELAADSEWLAAMEQAFAAPKYDNYLGRRFELDRDVMKRHALEDPLVAVMGVASQWIPSGHSMKIYSQVVLARGEQAERSRDPKAAEKQFWAVARFAERMALWGATDLERIVAASLQKESYAKLSSFLKKEGRANEAGPLASQLQALEKAEHSRWSSAMRARFDNYFWSAMLVQAATGIIMILAALSLAGTAALLIWKRGAGRWRRVLCGVVDYAPLLLVVAAGFLTLSYHPFARVFRSAMASRDPATHYRTLMESFYGFYRIPDFLMRADRLLWIKTGLWAAAVVALTALGSYIIWRMTRRHAAANPTT